MATIRPSNSMKFRASVVMMILFLVLFSYVAGTFFRISVIENKEYQKMANEQQFGSITISANRGTIFDSKGVTLAKSATVYKVFLDPKQYKLEMEELAEKIEKRNKEIAAGTYKVVVDKETNKEANSLPESVDKFKEEAIKILSETLGITSQTIEDAMAKNSQYVVLQDQVEKAVADRVLEFFNQYSLTCLNVEEDTKRYYPQNELAASVIGFTSGDGSGAYGLEAYYDDYLAGVDGKTISAKDSNGNELPYRYSKSYEPKDGDDVYLTIDMNIQYYLEKHLEEMSTKYETSNRSCAMLMNAKTGAIYGMATYPSFNLNDPREISDPLVSAELENLTGELAKQRTLEERELQWKNKCITEVYEPGSVFKVITSASAIEENKLNVNTDSFYCSGAVTMFGQTIKCHDTGGHGMQTFQEALTNSCNPAFMEIGSRLGVETFAYYFSAFGLNERTGIDLPAETQGIGGYPTMTDLDLAVSSFGQMETITPIEMITSYCATINGGYLLKPYVVDKIVDEDGNVVLKNERTVRRQVVSEDTSEQMRTALEGVVTNNSGGNVTIKGYSIGGKSGTSERLSIANNDEDYYGASYVCFTPADDPEIILLVLADCPNADIGYYGSTVAVPTARDILTDVLPYMGFYPEYTDEEVENLDVKVPLLQTSVAEAKTTLEELGVKYEIVGDGPYVVSQSPATGSSISKDGTVYLYTDERTTVEYTTVPDMIGLTPALANENIAYWGLNYVAKGASVLRSGAVVSKQSYEPGEKVPKGTTIELEFMVYAQQD